MVRFQRLAALAATVSLAAVCSTIPAVAGQRVHQTSQPAAEASHGTPIAEDSDARKIWEDDALFAQLSSAAQRQLERVFGKRARPGDQPPSIFAPYPLNFADKTAATNVLVNNPAGEGNNDTQSETSCLVNGGSVIAAFNDSASFSTAGGHFTGWSVSGDGGATFTDKGVLPNSTGGDAGDPVLAKDNASGFIYLATLAFNTNDNLQFWRSLDGAQTFQAPVNCTPDARAGDSMDKEWLAVDNFPGTGQGTIYCFWRNFGGGPVNGGMKLTRSTDGGATFGPIRPWITIEAQNGQGGFVTVGPDHAVYCFWLSGTTIKMRKSTDLGLTFGLPVVVATIASPGVNGDLGLSGGFRTNVFPQAVVSPTNPSVLYLVYDDVGATGGDAADIFIVTSADGGATWSAKQRVNDDATTRDQWQPALALTPDGSRLFVGYYSRQLDPANSLIDTFARVGTTSGATITFDPSQRVTDVSFPVEHGHDPQVVGSYMGDYDNASADSAFFYCTWGDNRDVNAGGNNADVRFAKIPVGSAPGADTIGLYQPSTATFFLRNSNAGGAADITTGYGGVAATPLIGDWDGNGTDTLGIYVPATSTFFLRNATSPGPADLAFPFGVGGLGYVPLVGDWDGNGTSTPGLYDPATSTFFLRNSNTSGAADITFTFGAPGLGYVPLVGDWNGDNVDTVALYQPSTATFFLRNANAPGAADLTIGYGGPGLVPLSGDYNGDGTDTIGVYDPASSAFFLRNSNSPGAADITAVFGGPGLGYVPLVGDYDGL